MKGDLLIVLWLVLPRLKFSQGERFDLDLRYGDVKTSYRTLNIKRLEMLFIVALKLTGV